MDNYEGIWIFVPKFMEILWVEEGTGDNLLPEDVAEGYCDYNTYEVYTMNGILEQTDGGMVMLDEYFRDKYKSTEDSVKDILEDVYGEVSDYVVLDESLKAPKKMPEKGNYDPVYVFVPSFMEIVKVMEANIIADDGLDKPEEGENRNYIVFKIYRMEGGLTEEIVNTNLVVLDEYFRDIYASTEDAVEDALKRIYSDVPEYVVLNKNTIPTVKKGAV